MRRSGASSITGQCRKRPTAGISSPATSRRFGGSRRPPGFTYQWDEETQQFAHVSGVLVTTPDGRLSRYFYGVEFSPKDLRLALVDSGQGTIGSVVEELLLYCFQYDPSDGRYGAVFMNILRLGWRADRWSHPGFHCADATTRDAPRRGKARLSVYVFRDSTLS